MLTLYGHGGSQPSRAVWWTCLIQELPFELCGLRIDQFGPAGPLAGLNPTRQRSVTWELMAPHDFRETPYLCTEKPSIADIAWSLAHHMEADGSPLDDLVLALRYQDDVVRVGDDWKIMRRRMLKQFHRGPFPRPSLGPPIYPRSK